MYIYTTHLYKVTCFGDQSAKPEDTANLMGALDSVTFETLINLILTTILAHPVGVWLEGAAA